MAFNRLCRNQVHAHTTEHATAGAQSAQRWQRRSSTVRSRQPKVIRCRCLHAGVSLLRHDLEHISTQFVINWQLISHLDLHVASTDRTWAHAPPPRPPFVNFVTISSSPPRARLSPLPLPLNCLSVLFKEVRPRPGRCHNGCRLRERSERVHRQWRRWRRRRRRRRRRGRLARDSDDGAP